MATPHSTTELTARGKVVLWLAGFAASAAWISGDENARLAAAMLTAPILIDFVAKQRHLHFTGVRIAPRRTVAGAFYIENVKIEHRGRRPLRNCQFHEPRLMRSGPPVLLPTMRPFEIHHAEIPERSLIRSHVIERVFVLESQWPLGMFMTRSVVTTPCELITEPMRLDLSVDVMNTPANRQSTSANRSALSTSEFYALREYIDGEDALSVHALRSAALGTPVKRTYSESKPLTVGIVLDLRQQPRRPLNQGRRRLEWSLSTCASLVERQHQKGLPQRVLIIDTKPELIEVGNKAELLGLMTLLSEASLSPHYALQASLFRDIKSLDHCYWIPAGGSTHAPELRNIAAEVTVISEMRD